MGVCKWTEHKHTFVYLVSSSLTLAFINTWKLVVVLREKVSTCVNKETMNLQTQFEHV